MSRLRALGLLLAAPALALADPPTPRVTFESVGLTVRVPAGFTAQRLADPSPDLLGTWVRAGASAAEGPVVLQCATVPGPVPETPQAGELAAWRGSDPYPFEDRAEAVPWRAWRLHVRAGTATVRGHAMVRFATVLPLAQGGVRVTVFAPRERAAEARQSFRAVVSTAEGDPGWVTAGQLRRERALLGVVIAALAGMALYGLLALAVFRRHDRWRRPRAAALTALAALWLAAAALAPRGMWRVFAQDLALAAVFAHRAWRLRRGG